MNRIKVCSILFLISLSLQAPAQHLDSIKNSFSQRSSFFLTLDSHNSFIGGRLVSISGIKAGLSYGRLVKVGVGLFGLSNPYTRNITIKAADGIGDTTVKSELKFSYL